MTDFFRQKINEIFKTITLPKKLAVAVSGGCDSLALTLILQEFCKEKNIELFAVTIDHKMRKNSTTEAQDVGKILKKFKISHQILTSNLQEKPTSNIENTLREMRFELLYQFCQKNKINLLFLGHHQGDLAENFLIRLFRGSGIDGLSSIEEISSYKKIKLIRPFLNFTKEDLQQYLQGRKIKWFEDESNQDEKFLRNKIRKFLNNLPDKNLINQRIANAAKQIAQSKKIIDEISVKKSQEILQFKNLGYFLLQKENFLELEESIALKLLAQSLMKISGAIYKPRFKKLQNIYEWIKAEKSHKSKTFYGCVLEKFDEENLIIYRERNAIDLKNIKYFDEKNVVVDNRFILTKSKSKDLFLLDEKAFNILAKKDKKLQKIKNPLKKVFYTIPFSKDSDLSKIDKLTLNFY